MLPLWLAQTEVQTTQKGQELGRMLYNELEQGDILSGVRVGLALLAYTDILLCSIWAMHRIRQTPDLYYALSELMQPVYTPNHMALFIDDRGSSQRHGCHRRRSVGA